jgi:hypothetical protein
MHSVLFLCVSHAAILSWLNSSLFQIFTKSIAYQGASRTKAMLEMHEIKNHNDLRKALCEAFLEVRYKRVEPEVGLVLSKIAAQVCEVSRIELNVNRFLVEQGEVKQKWGDLPLTVESKK